MDLVLYHHNHTKSNYPDLCSILKKADHHSASEREDIDDTQEVNKTPLISLFSKIVLEGNGKVDEQYIPLNKLSLDDGSFNNLKPAAKKDTMGGWNLVPEYNRLWDEFNSEFDRAESALKKALSYNPVSGEILSTLSALYDGNYDLNNLKKTAVEILKFSYDPREIAKAYRDLGYCYYENKKCNISKALYEQSLNYENHPRAQIELQLINSYLHIDETDIKKVLNDENIPANINDDILEISMFLALDFEKKNLLNQSLYFYGVLYNLTHDEEVLTKINDLKHRL